MTILARRRGCLIIACSISFVLVASTEGTASTGDRLWAVRNEGRYDNAAIDVVGPSHGLVFVTGDAADSPAPDTVAYAASDGRRVWASHGEIYIPEDSALSPDGRTLYVMGYEPPRTGDFEHIVFVAYDASTGDVRWIRRCCPTYLGGTGAVLPDPAGKVIYLMGSFAIYGGETFDMDVGAFDASGGHPIWHETYGHPSSDESAEALALAPDGSSLFVTGYRRKASEYDILTMAVDPATGERRWTRQFGGPGRDLGVDVGSTASRLYVTGTSEGTGTDIVTLAYRGSDGTPIWTRRYDGPGEGDDVAQALAINGDGSQVIVAGSQTGTDGDADYVALSYGPAGGTNWASTFGGGANGNDTARAVAIGRRSSRAYLTGVSESRDGDDDVATVALGLETGRRVWAHRYDGPKGDDSGSAIVAGSRRAFVAGASQGIHGSTDFITLAYRA